MPLNKYQRLLPRKLYHCRLVIEKPDTGRIYTSTIKRNQIHEMAMANPDAKIIGGNINTYLLINLPFVNMAKLTLKYLDEHLDTWVQQDCLMPELYLVGGYYPRKDFKHVFGIMQHNSKIYIYGVMPCTSMPVYKITDTTLVRCQCGDIPAPVKQTIDQQIDAQIRDALTTEPLYFIH